jgi:threonine dehydrogenase-like Zn-dependent dehydrogenase
MFSARRTREGELGVDAVAYPNQQRGAVQHLRRGNHVVQVGVAQGVQQGLQQLSHGTSRIIRSSVRIVRS